METNSSESPKPESPKDRPFECGCGKTYLSYPALYTHLKIKHNGAAPTGTSKHKASEKPPRSRARKKPPSTVLSTVSDLDLIRELGFLRKEPWTLPRSSFSSSFVRTLKSTHTCHDAFALYCEHLGKVMSFEGFQQFSRYLNYLTRCLNIHGWSLSNELPEADYCTTHNASLVPQMSNTFVQYFIPEQPEGDREIAIVFMFHLCNWLLQNSYTTYRVDILQHPEPNAKSDD